MPPHLGSVVLRKEFRASYMEVFSQLSFFPSLTFSFLKIGLLILFYVCMIVLPACMCLYHICAWCLRRSDRITELLQHRVGKNISAT